MAEKSRIVLYIKGNAKALTNPNIAVVGTRHPSEWSQKVEERLVKKILELSDRVVVSGLALGCDKIAHEATVDEGKANRSYFVERDAIVAALSDVTFVVECDVKSGTMHTVDAASEYKRRLSCYYPPSMEMGGYAGNEFMVKTKKAIKVSDTGDLIKLFSLMEDDDSENPIKEPHQLSFEDYLKNS